MNKLKFKLITNNQIVIDEEVNYFIKEDIFKFKIDEVYYEYDKKNNIFSKKNNESLIKIELLKNNIVIVLLENNMFFDMEVQINRYEKNDKLVIIEYTFISDEKTTNCIIIEY